jgi:putative transposase
VVFIGIEKTTEEECSTMADEYRMALEGLQRRPRWMATRTSYERECAWMGQALMEVEVSQHIGADWHERPTDRTGQRNGYRWNMRVGSIELKVPRVWDGSFYLVMLDPRKRAERALVAVVQEACVQGVSTRGVDDLVQPPGMNGINKSQALRLCQESDGEAEEPTCGLVLKPAGLQLRLWIQ